jgi:putative effector of murein hydrolase
LGIASAFTALWDGFVNSRQVLASVAKLFSFWLASFILHITMPTLMSVNTATVPTPVLVEVDTMPGNIINLGANLTLLGGLWTPIVGAYSVDLIGAMSALPYVWENKNSSIRLPLGVNETSVRFVDGIPC